jgi:hypothetical protein
MVELLLQAIQVKRIRNKELVHFAEEVVVL